MKGAVSELDLRLVRTFLTVVETGGITSAQAALGITQPTISGQLATLEARTGIRLCERGRAGFTVTTKGEQFLESARRLIAATESFTMEVQHINREMTGNINIGMLGQIDPLDTKRIAATVAELRVQHENLYFTFTELSPVLLEEKIINGSIDVAIGYFWRRTSNIEYFPLFKETQVAYCASNHPLFNRVGQLTHEDVKQYEWVWPSHPLPEMTPPAPIENLTVLTDSMDSAALFILSGQHLGFLPQHYAAQHERLGQLHALNSDKYSYKIKFHAAVKSASRHSYIIDAFLSQLLAMYE